MFVLSNAWRALTRSKGRTALTAFITLAVTFGTVAGLAIIQEDTNAHTTAYDQQKARWPFARLRLRGRRSPLRTRLPPSIT